MNDEVIDAATDLVKEAAHRRYADALGRVREAKAALEAAEKEIVEAENEWAIARLCLLPYEGQ